MVLYIVRYGVQMLEQVAKPVEKFDASLAKLCDDMFETMYHAGGIGLAAPQLGLSIRLAVVDVSSGSEPESRLVLVNPEVIESRDIQLAEEGCLSLPGFHGPVARPRSVLVRAQDVTGRPFEIRGEDLLARALCHEIDHLNGILFLSHLSRLRRDLIKRKIKRYLRRPSGVKLVKPTGVSSYDR